MSTNAPDFRRTPWFAVLGALLFGGVAGDSSCCYGDFYFHDNQLEIRTRTDWVASVSGGYQPIRVEVVNQGPPRDLEFRYDPHERGGGVRVTRRLHVDRGATAQVQVLIPRPSNETNSGTFTARLAGDDQPLLVDDVVLAPRRSQLGNGIALLVIDRRQFDTGAFTVGAIAAGGAGPDASENDRGGRMSMHRHFRYRDLQGEAPRSEFVAPELLPATWTGYSGIDIVAVELQQLRKIAPGARAALLAWVATGGRLIIHDAGAFDEADSEFRALLAEWGWNESLRDFSLADPRKGAAGLVMHPAPPERRPPNEGNPFGFGNRLDARLGTPEDRIEASWTGGANPLAICPHGFGRVAVVANGVESANAADWRWLLVELGGPTIPWSVRHGMIAGAGDREFINFPIPGVRGVPTIAFLVMISVFAILIGPVNYFLLWRKGQLSRLLLTVPFLALATSVLLFAYGMLMHGFDVKGRIRSVTWIDNAGDSATSVSRMSLFAGIAPSDGLSFSRGTAVYPLLPVGESFASGRVDWTDGQTLTDGWLRTRVWTQFVTVSHRDERGRLQVRETPEGLTAINGFEVPLRHLVATDSRGRKYYGKSISPGQRMRLHRLTDERRAAMRELTIERIPEPPDGVDPKDLLGQFGRQIRWDELRPQMNQSLLERHQGLVGQSFVENPAPPTDRSARQTSNRMLEAVRDDTRNPLSKPRGFLAITVENPGLDLGGLEVTERESLHVLMGRW